MQNGNATCAYVNLLPWENERVNYVVKCGVLIELLKFEVFLQICSALLVVSDAKRASCFAARRREPA